MPQANGTSKQVDVKYEARWHTKVPGSPDGTRPNWRVTRTWGKVEEIMVRSADGQGYEWVNKKEVWKPAEEAYVNWVASGRDPSLRPTGQQLDLPNRGHIETDMSQVQVDGGAMSQ